MLTLILIAWALAALVWGACLWRAARAPKAVNCRKYSMTRALLQNGGLR